jgi:hypothetical protein
MENVVNNSHVMVVIKKADYPSANVTVKKRLKTLANHHRHHHHQHQMKATIINKKKK